MSEINKKYIETIGRRKTSIARARMTPSAKSSFTVNDKSVEDYFKVKEQIAIATDAITKTPMEQKFAVTVMVKGGGVNGQAEATRHAIARGLITFDLSLRGNLKKAGYLKRDPRAKERRKFGLKKARKSPQWSKR
jgi:small subunit ribosomal protein S9